MRSKFTTKANPINGEWLITPALAQKAGIPLDMITRAFKMAQIPHSIVNQWPPKQEAHEMRTEPRVNLFSRSSEVVWDNGAVQVLIVKENDRYHLLFRPKWNASYEKISKENFLALKHKMKVIPDVFEKVFGFPDYCEQQVESENAFGYEIFPGFAEKPNVVDLVDKDLRNLYLLTRGVHQSYSLPRDKLESLKKELAAALNKNGSLTKRTFISERTEVKMKEALVFRVNAFARLLKEEGAQLTLVKSTRIKSAVSERKNDSRLQITKKCIFDNPAEKELIFKSRDVQVILNAKPYVGWNEPNSKHVLVTPIEHREDCTSVTDDEILAEKQAIINLKKEWKKLYPNHKYFIWKQQGIKAGQTVPHLHTQCLCAKTSEIWEYYRLMIQDIIKAPPMVFAPSPQLRKGLRNIVQ